MEKVTIDDIRVQYLELLKLLLSSYDACVHKNKIDTVRFIDRSVDEFDNLIDLMATYMDITDDDLRSFFDSKIVPEEALFSEIVEKP